MLPVRKWLNGMAMACLLGCFSIATLAEPPSTRLYVTNEDAGTLSVIDADRQVVIETLAIGRRPRGLKVSSDGAWLFVAVSGSPKCPPWKEDRGCATQEADKSADGIAQVELDSLTVVHVLPGGSDPEQFDVSPDGSRLYVANEDVDQLSVVQIEDGAILAELPTGGEPEGVRVSPDGRLVAVTSERDHRLTIIDTSSLQITTEIEVSKRPRDLIFSDDGKLAYVTAEVDGQVDIIDMVAFKRLDSIALPEGSRPVGLVMGPAGKHLYVATGRGGAVAEVDLERGQVVRSVEVGPRPWGIAIARDGRTLYTANGPSNDVSVVDLKTFRVTQSIPVGDSPWGIVRAP